MSWQARCSPARPACSTTAARGIPPSASCGPSPPNARLTHLGASAGYLLACQKAGIEPGRDYDLASLRFLGSTGSPLPVETFAWVYEHVKRDLWLSSSSGGTDVCTGFVGGCALAPVRAGELQQRALGVAAQAFDARGAPVTGEVGELVITEPMPSMPLHFWNDPGDARYHASYFEMYPGVWRHGDWIQIQPSGGAVIYGRSDATINRRGVRMGTSEIYRAVEALPEVLDSLALGVEQPDGGYFLPLFVVLREGVTLDDDLVARIREQIRSDRLAAPRPRRGDRRPRHSLHAQRQEDRSPAQEAAHGDERRARPHAGRGEQS